ncbi:lipase secretion chaperone [Noviherbaspirillum saxi]|nr:lipase secretion chaperone [Noviherbaspirillum saxi]
MTVGEDTLFSFIRPLDDVQLPPSPADPKPAKTRAAKDDALVIDTSLRRLFDHFLATKDETGIGDVRSAVEQEIDLRLRPGPAAEAKRLLARYLGYRLELAEMEKNAHMSEGSMEALGVQVDAISQTRARYFSVKEAQGLFDANDVYGPHAWARLEIYQDPFLSDLQKGERIAALDARLHQAQHEQSDASGQDEIGNKVRWQEEMAP